MEEFRTKINMYEFKIIEAPIKELIPKAKLKDITIRVPINRDFQKFKKPGLKINPLSLSKIEQSSKSNSLSKVVPDRISSAKNINHSNNISLDYSPKIEKDKSLKSSNSNKLLPINGFKLKKEMRLNTALPNIKVHKRLVSNIPLPKDRSANEPNFLEFTFKPKEEAISDVSNSNNNTITNTSCSLNTNKNNYTTKPHITTSIDKNRSSSKKSHIRSFDMSTINQDKPMESIKMALKPRLQLNKNIKMKLANLKNVKHLKLDISSGNTNKSESKITAEEPINKSVIPPLNNILSLIKYKTDDNIVNNLNLPKPPRINKNRFLSIKQSTGSELSNHNENTTMFTEINRVENKSYFSSGPDSKRVATPKIMKNHPSMKAFFN